MAAGTTGNYAHDKDLPLSRLTKIAVQMRGNRERTADDRYCTDVLQPISALESAAGATAAEVTCS
jgi:DNA-binding FrmR family transcriptional regulator